MDQLERYPGFSDSEVSGSSSENHRLKRAFAWRIIPFSKRLGSPLLISHETAIWKGKFPPFRGLTIPMVIKHLLNGMILQVMKGNISSRGRVYHLVRGSMARLAIASETSHGCLGELTSMVSRNIRSSTELGRFFAIYITHLHGVYFGFFIVVFFKIFWDRDHNQVLEGLCNIQDSWDARAVPPSQKKPSSPGCHIHFL